MYNKKIFVHNNNIRLILVEIRVIQDVVKYVLYYSNKDV